MHYLKSLIKNGDALAFQTFAHPPTVTLPRIKVNIFNDIKIKQNKAIIFIF